MKTKVILLFAAIIGVSAKYAQTHKMKMATDIPQSLIIPDTVEYSSATYLGGVMKIHNFDRIGSVQFESEVHRIPALHIAKPLSLIILTFFNH